MILTIILNFVLSFLITVICVPIFKNLGIKYNILDYPDNRKIHRKPIPRTGGLSFIFIFILLVFLNLFLNKRIGNLLINISPAILVLLIIGVYDDAKNIKPKIKLLFQIIAASLLYFKGININKITNPLGGEIYLGNLISFFVTLFWVIGLINAINLLDGMDGLASGVLLISNIFLFIIAMGSKNFLIAIFCSIMIGLTAGFLIYNFPPAKIFMGDTGSMFLGFMMAVIGMIGNRKSVVGITLLIPILLMLLPIIDTFLAIFRRVKNRESIFKADKKHIHHRLLALGISTKRVLFIIYLINVYLGLIALLSLVLKNEYIFILLLILAVGIIIGLEALRILEENKNSASV